MSNNAEAMRKALLDIQEYAAAMDVNDGNVLAILDSCRDALDAPPRNCDVGSADEQRLRYYAFCDKRECEHCELTRIGCQFAWMQMPYEEGGAE